MNEMNEKWNQSKNRQWLKITQPDFFFPCHNILGYLWYVLWEDGSLISKKKKKINTHQI